MKHFLGFFLDSNIIEKCLNIFEILFYVSSIMSAYHISIKKITSSSLIQHNSAKFIYESTVSQ